jgi:Icc-related predicted phosphoesterase
VRENGGYRANFLGRTEHAMTEDELVELEKQIRFNGFYPYRCDSDELEQLRADSDYLARVFQQLIRVEVERWVAIADDRVAAAGVPCVMMSGNDDDTYVDEVLSSSKVVRNVDGAVVEFGPYQVMGFGFSNPTPWNSPRELSEPEIEARLHRVAREIDNSAQAIFNIHVPPYNSSLDLAPKLKADLSFATTGSQPHTVPVGSTAVRQLIEERQPLLSLHGHVHESRAATRIGSTVCINPGSEYNNGILRGAIVRLSGEKVLGYQFVNG